MSTLSARRYSGANVAVPVVGGPGARPPYLRPSLLSLKRRRPEPNAPTVVSLFTGAGGACLGFRMAGFRVLWANEFVPAAAETYRANFPEIPLDVRDVRKVDAAEILKAIGKKRLEVDVVEGSPPCAAFSSAGRRSAAWGEKRSYSDVKQRVDDLFEEYVRIVRGIRPKAFVVENVAGLVRGVSVGHFNALLGALGGLGYAVKAKLLDAAWLGVPQSRRRLFVVGVRDDLGVAPPFPKPLPYRYALRDALPGLSAVRTKGGTRSAALPAPTVLTHGRRRTQSELSAVEGGASLARFEIGKEWGKLRPGEQSERYFSLVRPALDRPCPTVTQTGGNASAASVTHPSECRKFSIAELKAVCGFPDDFVLTGTYAQQWERLGRAVPPPMAYHVARALREGVFR